MGPHTPLSSMCRHRGRILCAGHTHSYILRGVVLITVVLFGFYGLQREAFKGGDPRCWPSLRYLGQTPEAGVRGSLEGLSHFLQSTSNMANQGAAGWPCWGTFLEGLGGLKSTQHVRSSMTRYCRSKAPCTTHRCPPFRMMPPSTACQV